MDKRKVGYRAGGMVNDIPEPRVRRFPNSSQARAVVVDVMTFQGTSLGAHHYHVDFREKDNPYWNEANQMWQVSHDDKAGRGDMFTTKFDTLYQAVNYLRRISELAYCFPEWILTTGDEEETFEEYIVRLESYLEPVPGPFFYERVGD